MSKEFKESVYNSAYKALTESGVPNEIADKASVVVASDDANLPDLGRTQEDRNNIAEAMKHYWENQSEE